MEFAKSRDGKYRIETISKANFEGGMKVMRDAFCQDESVCIGCEIDKNPNAADELLELCADAALDSVSLVAVCIETGEVASAAFNKLQVPASSVTEKPFFEIFAEERCSQESSKSLVNFMADVDARCGFFQKLGVDCSLEIMFLATLKEHRGHGLAQLLCKESVELARRLKSGPVARMDVGDLGPNYANMKSRAIPTAHPKICQAIWTSFISQKIGRNLGFIVDNSVPFTEFVYNGKTYADRIGSHTPFCEVAYVRV